MSRPDPIKTLTREEVQRVTGGSFARVIPLVRLVEMLRGRSGYVPCPHCREPRHPDATVCPHCRNDLVGGV